MYRSELFEASLAAELFEVNQEDELFNLHTVLLAIYDNAHRLHRVCNTLGCSARSENVVEESNLEYVAFGFAGSDVAQSIEECVESVLLLDAYLDKVALVEGEFAALADRNDILHLLVG